VKFENIVESGNKIHKPNQSINQSINVNTPSFVPVNIVESGIKHHNHNNTCIQCLFSKDHHFFT
jgi:hypothetical protein